MHGLVVLSILNNTVMVLALDALKTDCVLPVEAAKYVLDLFLCEVVGTGFVVAHIEVVLQFRCLSLSKSQLSQVVSPIVSEVEDSTWKQLVVNLTSHCLVILWRDGR